MIRLPLVPILVLAAALAAWSGPLGAEEALEPEPEAAPAEAPADAPAVGLDALLRLPDSVRQGPGSTPDAGAGAERQRWEERFAERRDALDRARRSLAEAQQELEELAGQTDSWQIAAPGAAPNVENSPVSYKLRQQIRGLRDAVAAEERRLRELEVEASLAGVPAEWRGPRHEDAAPGS